METNWTAGMALSHREYVLRRLVVINEYLRACDFQDVPPLRCTVSLLARKIREYRIANKFYDVV